MARRRQGRAAGAPWPSAEQGG
jgi:putative transposase